MLLSSLNSEMKCGHECYTGDLSVAQGSVLGAQNGESCGETRAASQGSRTKAEPAAFRGCVCVCVSRWPRRMGGRLGQASKVVQTEVQVAKQSGFLGAPVLWSRGERTRGFDHL